MAPTAPAPSGIRTGRPDVFSERTHKIARWGLPGVIAPVYGNWAAVNWRHGGPITAGDVRLGVFSALAFFVLYAAVDLVARSLRPDLHALRALSRAVFAGVAFGFLYSRSDNDPRAMVLMSLALTAGLFLLLFYRLHTRHA
ncbi:hypothetical protein [Streptomyces sp. NPDC002788]